MDIPVFCSYWYYNVSVWSGVLIKRVQGHASCIFAGEGLELRCGGKFSKLVEGGRINVDYWCNGASSLVGFNQVFEGKLFSATLAL